MGTWDQLVASPERLVGLETEHDPGDGAHGGGDADDQASYTENLEAYPFRAPFMDFHLDDVHLNREINRQRPES